MDRNQFERDSLAQLKNKIVQWGLKPVEGDIKRLDDEVSELVVETECGHIITYLIQM